MNNNDKKLCTLRELVLAYHAVQRAYTEFYASCGPLADDVMCGLERRTIDWLDDAAPADPRDVIAAHLDMLLPKTRYAAGWNMPGYMPDNPAEEFDTFDEAKRYIISELKTCEDSAMTEENAETICAFAEEVNLQSGAFGATCGMYHYYVSEI